MLRSARKHASIAGAADSTISFIDMYHGPVGLLPWQGALLGGVCGVFALVHPLEAAISLLVLWFVWCGLGGRARTGLAMLLVFGLGLLLAWMHLPDKPALPDWVGDNSVVTLQGVVDEVQSRPDRRFTVLLRDVKGAVAENAPAGNRAVSLPGRVSWAWHAPTDRLLPGQAVTVKVRVEPMHGFGNPGSWDYALAQRIQSVHTRIYTRAGGGDLQLGPMPEQPAQRWRRELIQTIGNASPGQGGAMLAALLTGDRFNLSPATLERVRAAGLSHSLALSGLHLAFVVMIGLGLTWGISLAWPPLLLHLPRAKLAVLVSAPLVLIYLWLGGFAPSLLRASLMFAFMGFFLLQGRDRVVVDGLFFALAVILVFDPLAALDIRLQLSAVAVAGIGLFLPVVLGAGRNLPGMSHRSVKWAAGVLAVSLCATLCVLPISVRTFGMFAPNLLLNVVWLPLLGVVVMPLGLIGLLLSLVSMPLAGVLFHMAGAVLDVMLAGLGSVEQLGWLPILQLLRPLWPELLGAGVLLACLGASFRMDRRQERFFWAVVMLGAVLMIAPHVQVMVEDATSLRLEVVDVGAGQSLVVTRPGGHRTVVDGGGLRSRTFDAGRDVVAPYLTLGRPPRIDNVILTHAHADHYKGLIHLLTTFKVDHFYYGVGLPKGTYRKPFLAALGDLEPTRLLAGDALDLGSGVRLVALHPARGYDPPSTNDGSLVLRLMHQEQGLALLCGDIEHPALEALLANGQDLTAQVLVLPHHGSHTSYQPRLYDRVRPSLALCSSGFQSRRVHPYAPVVEDLAAVGCPVLSTWKQGLLRVVWKQTGWANAVEYYVQTGM